MRDRLLIPGTRRPETEHRIGGAAIVGLFLLLGASAGRAQRPAPAVQVHVADSSGRAVGGASVEILRGLGARVADGLTDSVGMANLAAPRNEDLEVVVRRIGFQRWSALFRIESVERRFDIVLQRAPVSLPAVDVTAQRDINRARYHLDADDIENARRPILDGLDAVLKLRPDMADPPNDGIFTHCGLYNLFVNGERVRYPPVNEAVAQKVYQQRMAAILATQPFRQPHYSTQAKIPISIQSALSMIRPEHIEEMNYVNCSDMKSADNVRAQNGVFVVLKRGVAYDPGRGSYVVARDASDASHPRLASPIANGSSASFRFRVVGIFDEATGNPLAGVQVIDLKSETFATTTSSGTASLAFLPEGSNELALRRAGYAEVRLTVTISPVDTVPLTIIMRPAPKP